MRAWLAGRLLAFGLWAIDRERYELADWFADGLRRLRNTAEFELRARIALAQRDDARAVEILRVPADRYPEVWILNSLLGEAFSNQGAYESARERFELVIRHSGGAGVGPLNLAVIASREGNHQEALDRLDAIEGDGGAPKGAIETTRAHSLAALGRFAEAEAILRVALLEKGKVGNRAAAHLALVLAQMELEEEAWAAVHESFRREPGYPEASEATRVLLGGTAAREYAVQLDGLVDPATHPLGKRLGFFTDVYINADNEDEALAIARRIEPDLLDLRLSEATWKEVGEDARKGYVSRRRGHWLYRNTSSWDS